MTFRPSPRPPVGALQPLHEIVAAAKQRFVLGFERALAFAPDVEAPDLLHRPAQAAVQTRDDRVQAVGEGFDVRAEHHRGRHVGIRLRPALLEHPLHAGSELRGIALHEIAQCAQVERFAPYFPAVEQVRRHAGR